MEKNIAINEFVKRQVEKSEFSHFNGSWDELVTLVEQNFEKATPGYRDGVMLVPVPPQDFRCSVTDLTPDSELTATFSARRDGEEPFIQIRAKGEKSQAQVVEVVIYRKDILGKDATTDSEWEIISLNSRPTNEPEPMHPYTMARNMMGLEGGTKGEYTAQQFAEAILYWNRKALCAVPAK